MYFLHDRPWISPCIKSTSNEDIIIHVIASQLSGYCDVMNNPLWRHQQNVNLASDSRVGVWQSAFLSSLCRVKNKLMHVLSWWAVSALTRVLFWCLFGILFYNKHQNNPVLSAETFCHPRRYSILATQAANHDWIQCVQYLLSKCSMWKCKYILGNAW